MNRPEIKGASDARPLIEAARLLGLTEADLRPSGPHLVRVSLGLLEREVVRQKARCAVVVAMSPTACDGGASALAIGAAMASRRVGVRAVSATGFPPADAGPGEVLVGCGGDPDPGGEQRALDAACALLGGRQGLRDELRAVLALARDHADLRARLERLDGQGAERAEPAAVVLRETLHPGLGQAVDGAPVLLHGGAPEDVTAGCSSVVADCIGLRCADLLVTATPLRTALGAERFFNVKCRCSGLRPHAAVLVCATGARAADLEAQVGILRLHGLPVVVCVARRPQDGEAAVAATVEAAGVAGAFDVVVASATPRGGTGGEPLARALGRAVDEPPCFRFLYPEVASLREKIEAVARRVHGAAEVVYDRRAEAALDRLEELGCGRMPVCVAAAPESGSAVFRVEDADAWPAAGFVRIAAGAR